MSSLVSKTVTGTLKYADGTVWPSGKIVFTPIAVFGSTPVTVPVKEFSVFTGADGTFSIVLYSYDDASVAYNCLLPSGDEFNFNLPQGSGSTTLETLRRLSYTPPETGYSHSALTDLDEDDHPQYLTEARADLLYEPLGGGGGGVTDHGALTGLGDDDHTQYFNTARGDARYSLLGHNHSGTYQPANSDLSAIAALTPTNDDVLQRKAGAWVNRTPAQFKADLALSKSDVGLSNVPNADATARANHSGTQLAATVSDFASTVRSTVLTGLGTGSDTPIAATDTLLAALENLQAQIDGIGGASSPLTLTANSASEVPLTIQLASSQTANGFEIRDASNTLKFGIAPSGLVAIDYDGGFRYGTQAYLVPYNGGAGQYFDLAAAGDFCIRAAAAKKLRLGISTVESLVLDDDANSGNTRLLIYDVDNGQLERVTVGAADSGGSGYKLLRIPN